MNYFPFHLGDYSAHTAHLEPMEDLAYRRLLDQYYMKEGPLPADIQVTAKLCRMRSMMADIESVLKEFFTLTAAGWMHDRCEIEICNMQERQKMAKAKANKRWHMPRPEHSIAPAQVLDAAASAAAQDLGNPAMLPIPLPLPLPLPIKKNTSAVAPPDGVSESVWQDFCQHRKDKKAKLTQTALDGITREAAKAGWTLEAALSECCARGWTGFKADWVSDKPRQPETFRERDARNARQRFEEATGQRSTNFIDEAFLEIPQ